VGGPVLKALIGFGFGDAKAKRGPVREAAAESLTQQLPGTKRCGAAKPVEGKDGGGGHDWENESWLSGQLTSGVQAGMIDL
jgi:hypothetical protein